MEDGLGYSMATDLVNEQRVQDNLEQVGQTAVQNSYLRLQPEEEKVVTVSQGSFCAHSNWAKAGFAWCKQLAICFGLLDPHVTLDPPMPRPLVESEIPPPEFPLTVEGGIADCFDSELLQKYNHYQVAFWDECHPKCDLRSSDCGRKQNTSVPRVKRDKDGKLDQKGTYTKTKPTNTKVKYEKEGRFAFGVAMVKLRDGTIQGRRCEEFCYTEQNIIAHDQWIEKMDAEVRRVKKMIGTDKEDKWITDPGKGKIYADDGVNKIRGVGTVMKNKMKDAGITTVQELMNLHDGDQEAFKRFTQKVRCSVKSLQTKPLFFQILLALLALIIYAKLIRTRACLRKDGKRR